MLFVLYGRRIMPIVYQLHAISYLLFTKSACLHFKLLLSHVIKISRKKQHKPNNRKCNSFFFQHIFNTFLWKNKEKIFFIMKMFTLLGKKVLKKADNKIWIQILFYCSFRLILSLSIFLNCKLRYKNWQ